MSKKNPDGKQKYKGNGKHNWETVAKNEHGYASAERLRVPGGWLYRTEYEGMCFVPVPDVVGYAV